MGKINISPPPSNVEEFDSIWRNWINLLFTRTTSGPLLIRGYTVATLPSATLASDNSEFSSIIYVSDEVGGSVLAFSDGTNWRRSTDRAIIS